MKTISLTRGYVALVDDEDYERLAAFKWHAYVNRTNIIRVYAIRDIGNTREGNRKIVYMHREVLGCAGRVDHHDNDGLNNQRRNLRRATQSQNMHNRRKSPGKSSQFKGVHWSTRYQKWEAHIRNGLPYSTYLGRYASEYDAALAYNAAAVKAFGEFARLNDLSQREAA